MLQVTEEYVDGGYVYTVKDTDKYDAQMQELLDTKATCLAEPDMIGAIVGLEELKCSLFEEKDYKSEYDNLPRTNYVILSILKDWDEEQIDTVSYDEVVEKISGLNLFFSEKGKEEAVAVLDNHFGKFI
jgi:hypothetical protein